MKSALPKEWLHLMCYLQLPAGTSCSPASPSEAEEGRRGHTSARGLFGSDGQVRWAHGAGAISPAVEAEGGGEPREGEEVAWDAEERQENPTGGVGAAAEGEKRLPAVYQKLQERWVCCSKNFLFCSFDIDMSCEKQYQYLIHFSIYESVLMTKSRKMSFVALVFEGYIIVFPDHSWCIFGY